MNGDEYNLFRGIHTKGNRGMQVERQVMGLFILQLESFRLMLLYNLLFSDVVSNVTSIPLER